MKKNKHIRKVILAIDLKANDPKLTERIWNALEPLLKNKEILVAPVAILNREDAALGKVLKNEIGKLRDVAQRHLGEHLTEMGFNGFSAPQVIFADGSSTQRAVTALLSYAKKNACDLIAISSRSRKGLKRFFLGSFAEALSLQSSIPLLVVNPAQQSSEKKSNTILFPTDFSKKSKSGLKLVCDSIPDKNSKIILFHSYLLPMQMYAPFVSFPLPPSLFEEELEKTKKLGQSWCKELKSKGIACEFIVDEKSNSATAGILSAAKRNKVSTTAMVSTTSRIEALFLGSITRQVLRESVNPVWVVHP